MVYPVLCTAVCYVTVITLFIEKVGVVRPNFGGLDPPPPPLPSGCALGITRSGLAVDILGGLLISGGSQFFDSAHL